MATRNKRPGSPEVAHIAQRAKDQAELAELRLEAAKQSARLDAISASMSAAGAEDEDEASQLRTQLILSQQRERASASNSAAAIWALQAERAQVQAVEKQRDSLGMQVLQQRNATATAANTSLNLQRQLKALEDDSADLIQHANKRANRAEADAREAEIHREQAQARTETAEAERDVAHTRMTIAEQLTTTAEKGFRDHCAQAARQIAEAEERAARAEQGHESAKKDLAAMEARVGKVTERKRSPPVT